MSLNSQETSRLLDQLQNEVNRVLEQTGKIFVAARDDPKTVPVVQVTKLKQILPGSIERFHEALDQLQDELQTAKLVMRRELALCRERSGITKAPQMNGTGAAGDATNEEAEAREQPGSINDSKPDVPVDQLEKEAPGEDVSMQDVELDQSLQMETSVEGGPSDDRGSTILPGEEESKVEDQSPETKPEVKDAETDQKPADIALQIDTQTQPKTQEAEPDDPDEDKPPDTAAYTNDLESLFGAPTSAEAGEAPDFNMEPNNNDEFDFGFSSNLDNSGADNDNISALLPGLQDYANTQPTEGGEPDFSSLFPTDVAMGNDGREDGQQTNMEHRDSTFDDLMDFADFNPADYTEGSGVANENQEFDFSFD